MADYEQIRIGKLVLKGEKHKKSKKRKKEKKNQEDHESSKKLKIDEDAVKHGGWWQAKTTLEITGTVALQFGDRAYLRALDNGLFTLGPPHRDGEGPDPEEIFTAFPTSDTKVSFKSGYGKYLRAEKDLEVTGRSEAVGVLEQWEPVFENDQMALLAHNGCFMGIDPEDDRCVAMRKKVTEHEVLVIRSNAQRESEVLLDDQAKDDNADLNEVEKTYVKKFQKFQDKKMRISKNSVKDLEVAKQEGALHEALLDRRSKMKADRYCK